MEEIKRKIVKVEPLYITIILILFGVMCFLYLASKISIYIRIFLFLVFIIIYLKKVLKYFYISNHSVVINYPLGYFKTEVPMDIVKKVIFKKGGGFSSLYSFSFIYGDGDKKSNFNFNIYALDNKIEEILKIMIEKKIKIELGSNESVVYFFNKASAALAERNINH